MVISVIFIIIQRYILDKQNTSKIFGTAVIMAIITVMSKLFGLLRDILIASSYGMSTDAIAFSAASKLPLTVFEFVIGGVITAAFIPVFNELLVKKTKEDAFDYANSYINLILIIAITVALVGIIFAPYLVSWIAPELSEEASLLAAKLTRILFPMVIFTGIAFSFVGILQSFGEFRIPALISLVANCIMVAYLMTINKSFGIVGLAVAMLLGWSSQAVIQVPKLRSLGYRYRLKCDITSPYIRKSMSNAVPILLSSWTQPICNVINTRFASGIEGGRAITALDYANKLYTVIVGIFTFVATNLLFPYFSRSTASGDTEGSKSLLKSSVKILVFIIAPITVGIIALSEPFIALVYERNEFTAADTLLTAEAMRCYAIGMVFLAVNEVITKMFFASDKTKIPMFTSIISMTVNIAIVVLFADKLGVAGIALASGIAVFLSAAINAAIAAKLGYLSLDRHDMTDLAKSLACAAVMGAAVALVRYLLSGASVIIVMASSIAAGVVMYALLALVLRSDEMAVILSAVKGRKAE